MDIVNMIMGTSARRQKAEDMAQQGHIERVRTGQMGREDSEAVRVKMLTDMGYAPAPVTLRAPQATPQPAAPMPTAAQGYQNQQDMRSATTGLDLSTGKPLAPPQPAPLFQAKAIGEANPANAQVLEEAGMGSPLRRRPVQP